MSKFEQYKRNLFWQENVSVPSDFMFVLVFCLFMVEVKCCLPLSHRANMVSMVPLKLRRRRTTLIWLKAIPIQTKNFSALQTKLLQTRWKGNQFAYFSGWNINSILLKKIIFFYLSFFCFSPSNAFLCHSANFGRHFSFSLTHTLTPNPQRGVHNAVYITPK